MADLKKGKIGRGKIRVGDRRTLYLTCDVIVAFQFQANGEEVYLFGRKTNQQFCKMNTVAHISKTQGCIIIIL